MTVARGSFEVTGGTEDPYDELEGGIKLTHASGSQAFSGDVTGECAVHWLMLYRTDEHRPLRRIAADHGVGRRPDGLLRRFGRR